MQINVTKQFYRLFFSSHCLHMSIEASAFSILVIMKKYLLSLARHSSLRFQFFSTWSCRTSRPRLRLVCHPWWLQSRKKPIIITNKNLVFKQIANIGVKKKLVLLFLCYPGGGFWLARFDSTACLAEKSELCHRIRINRNDEICLIISEFLKCIPIQHLEPLSKIFQNTHLGLNEERLRVCVNCWCDANWYWSLMSG